MHPKLCISAGKCHLKYYSGSCKQGSPSPMALLEKRMLGLTADLSSAVARLADDKVAPKNVHRLRTTIRRIESLVSYANPDLDRKLERSLEKMADLRKRAGKVRDLDVQASLLDGVG